MWRVDAHAAAQAACRMGVIYLLFATYFSNVLRSLAANQAHEGGSCSSCRAASRGWNCRCWLLASICQDRPTRQRLEQLVESFGDLLRGLLGGFLFLSSTKSLMVVSRHTA
jgi:hypothetical protein